MPRCRGGRRSHPGGGGQHTHLATGETVTTTAWFTCLAAPHPVEMRREWQDVYRSSSPGVCKNTEAPRCAAGRGHREALEGAFPRKRPVVCLAVGKARWRCFLIEEFLILIVIKDNALRPSEYDIEQRLRQIALAVHPCIEAVQYSSILGHIT